MRPQAPLVKRLASLPQQRTGEQSPAFPLPLLQPFPFWWLLQQVVSGILLMLGLALLLSLAFLARPLSLQNHISWFLNHQHGELRWWEPTPGASHLWDIPACFGSGPITVVDFP